MNQHIEMMRLADDVAKKSVCKRAQVGAVWFCADGDIYSGFNHNPDGRSCECEHGKTMPQVIHAEAAAIEKNINVDDRPAGTLYVTRQPCIKCARFVVEVGIEQVFYRDADDKTDGLELLAAHGVLVDSGWIAGQSKPLLEPTLMQKIQASWLARWSI